MGSRVNSNRKSSYNYRSRWRSKGDRLIPFHPSATRCLKVEVEVAEVVAEEVAVDPHMGLGLVAKDIAAAVAMVG
jgi:hypothetical protein